MNWLKNIFAGGSNQKVRIDQHFQNLVILAVDAAKVDGRLNQKEHDAIANQFCFIPGQQEFFSRFEQSLPTYQMELVAAQVGEFNDSYMSWYLILRSLFLVMCADGVANEAEYEWQKRFTDAAKLDADFAMLIGSFYFGREADGKQQSEWRLLLGVEKNADADQIKRAYRQKATEFHPDGLPGINEAVKQLAEDRFKQVNSAFKNLMDGQKGKQDLKQLHTVDSSGAWKTLDQMNKGDVVICTNESCNQKNRLPDEVDFYTARCGSCHSYLGLFYYQAGLVQKHSEHNGKVFTDAFYSWKRNQNTAESV